MEFSFTDFLSELKDRFRRPFYWAFIFSWLIVNWRILIIIFSYENTDCQTGILNCIEEKHLLKITALVCYPLVGALIYTLLVPILDIGVSYVRIQHIQRLYNKIRYGKRALFTGPEMKRVQERYEKLKDVETRFISQREEKEILDQTIQELRSQNS